MEKQNIIIDPYQIFHQALANSKPFLETTNVKRGGANYQVPVLIRDKRQEFLAMKWLIEAAKEKDRNMRFYDKLALELLDAAYNTVSVSILHSVNHEFS